MEAMLLSSLSSSMLLKMLFCRQIYVILPVLGADDSRPFVATASFVPRLIHEPWSDERRT